MGKLFHNPAAVIDDLIRRKKHIDVAKVKYGGLSTGEVENVLKEWRAVRANDQNYGYHLIHILRYKGGDLNLAPFESTVLNWDVLSTSLIDVKREKPLFHVMPLGKTAQDLKLKSLYTSGLNKTKSTAMEGVGFILDVPEQNIIGTFSDDVFFPNHVGVQEGRKILGQTSYLTDAIFNGVAITIKSDAPDGFNKIEPPARVMMNMPEGAYNETLVLGRPFISVYPGRKASAPIKLKRIFVNVQSMPMDFKEAYKRCKELSVHLKEICAINKGIDAYVNFTIALNDEAETLKIGSYKRLSMEEFVAYAEACFNA